MCKLCIAYLFLCVYCSPQTLWSAELKWEDVHFTSGPYVGANKISWKDRNEEQKAAYLELYYKAIVHCQDNLYKSTGTLNLTISGRMSQSFKWVTPELISSLYRHYGDSRKAAGMMYKYWIDSGHNPSLQSADGFSEDYIISGYEEAGMYKELTTFYPQANDEKIKHLARISNIKLFKEDFAAYKKRWPQEANDYREFMRKWEEAKKLAKTTKPKPLDPAVQHHEWFYSDKQEEVLKALAYYHEHKVAFMLEKALKHKDPVVVAKAKEYLESIDKDNGVGDEAKN